MDFGSTGNFEQAPTGVHKAKLFSIIDLGTQEGSYEGKPTKNRQLHFTWELVDETKEDGKPFVISRFYNQSLGDRSNFILDMTSWFGKAPEIPSSRDEIGAFMESFLKSLLGKGCQLVIVEKEGKHRVSTITGLGKTDKLTTDTVNESLYLDLDKFDEEVFDKVPKGLQGMIMKSPEYAKAIGVGEQEDDSSEEEIPF